MWQNLITAWFIATSHCSRGASSLPWSTLGWLRAAWELCSLLPAAGAGGSSRCWNLGPPGGDQAKALQAPDAGMGEVKLGLLDTHTHSTLRQLHAAFLAWAMKLVYVPKESNWRLCPFHCSDFLCSCTSSSRIQILQDHSFPSWDPLGGPIPLPSQSPLEGPVKAPRLRSRSVASW